MPDQILIRAGSAGKHWPELSGPDDSCTPACFRTGSVWPKPDTISQNEIGSGLVLYNVIQDVCGRMQLSLKMGNWQRAGCVLPGTGLDDSCKPACFRPDKLGQTLTRTSRSDPGQFCTAWLMPSLEKWNREGCWRLDPACTIPPDSGYMLAVMAITGCNQNASELDPPCLLGWHKHGPLKLDIKEVVHTAQASCGVCHRCVQINQSHDPLLSKQNSEKLI